MRGKRGKAWAIKLAWLLGGIKAAINREINAGVTRLQRQGEFIAGRKKVTWAWGRAVIEVGKKGVGRACLRLCGCGFE